MCSYKFDNKIKKYKYSEILQKFHKFVLSKKSFVQLFSSEKVFWKTGFAKLGRTFLTVPCVKQAKVTKRTTWEYTKNVWEYTLFGVDEAPPPSIRKSVVDIFHIATSLCQPSSYSSIINVCGENIMNHLLQHYHHQFTTDRFRVNIVINTTTTTRGEGIVFWWPNMNMKIIWLFKNERIRILFGLKKATEYK